MHINTWRNLSSVFFILIFLLLKLLFTLYLSILSTGNMYSFIINFCFLSLFLSLFFRNHFQQQDPLSHRIIEKRRRDRMNSCLADLSRLIPPQFQRKGRGRIEKTEIIEMSIRYMKQLQNQECLHKENVYKMGYDECLQQAANFLYNTNREICYQLVDHLKEHSNDFMKGKYTNDTRFAIRARSTYQSPIVDEFSIWISHHGHSSWRHKW